MVFVISIRKDIDNGFKFNIPNKQGDIKDFVDDINENVDSKIMKSCIEVFKEEYENIIKSDKDIYQCKATSGFQDKKVGITVSPTLRANKAHTCVLINNHIKRLNYLNDKFPQKRLLH